MGREWDHTRTQAHAHAHTHARTASPDTSQHIGLHRPSVLLVSTHFSVGRSSWNFYQFIYELTFQGPVVIIYTSHFRSHWLYILLIKWNYGFHVILRVDRDYAVTQHCLSTKRTSGHWLGTFSFLSLLPLSRVSLSALPPFSFPQLQCVKKGRCIIGIRTHTLKLIISFHCRVYSVINKIF